MRAGHQIFSKNCIVEQILPTNAKGAELPAVLPDSPYHGF